MQRSKPTRKRLILLLALATSLTFFLVLGELSLHVVYRVQNGTWLWQHAAFRIGYTEPVADRRQYTVRRNWTDKSAGVSINRFAFRGPEIDPKSSRALIALGDSVPFGAGVKDEETYPARLDRLLSASGRSVRVVNAGVPSYNLRQSFDRLQLEALRLYHAPVAITVQAANDFSLLTHYREKYTPDVTWADLRLRGSWATPFARFGVLHYLDRAVSAKPALSNNEEHQEFPSDQMIANVRHVLEEGVRFCGDHSIKVILLPIDPFYYQTKNTGRNATLSRWSIPAYRRYVTMWGRSIVEFNRVLIEMSHRHPGVHFFDTRSLLDDQDREQMYIDFIHYSVSGNAVIAQGLFEFLLTREVLGTNYFPVQNTGD